MAFARDKGIQLTFEACDRIRTMMREQGPEFDRPKALAFIPAPKSSMLAEAERNGLDIAS